MVSPVEDLMGYWIERVERDLRPFADPGTDLKVEPRGRVIDVKWSRKDQQQHTIFHIAPDQVTVEAGNGRITYRSFFASDAMGDVLGVSKVTARTRRQTTFASTKARRLDQAHFEAIPAVDALLRALSDDSAEDATLVVVATGEAGAGKTSVLMELVRRQADAYLRGQSDFIFLYINAQGRALARFDEALATELQDMRVGLTYHAIPCLVRLGLIVPVVDGFDELLGVGGYEDAFSSLSAFIEELDGHGKIIASARSTYYEQEFVHRANKRSALGGQIWTQIPVEVLGWKEDEFDEFIRLKCKERGLSPEQTASVREEVSQAFAGENTDLRMKPFFVVQTVELVLDGVELARDKNLLDELVRQFLERERTQKLTDTHGGSFLSTHQLEMLLVELAEEMWNQETRELDKKSVSEVAEYVMAAESLSDATKRIVIEKMPKLAFLRTGEREGRVAFEHETFFAYFLANSIVRAVANGSSPGAPFLSRSVLPEDVSSIATRHMWDEDILPSMLNNIVSALGTVATTAMTRSEQVRENAGLLVADFLRTAPSHGVVVVDCKFVALIFAGSDFGSARVERSSFQDVEFRRADLSRATFTRCTANSVLLIEPVIQPGVTKLELKGLNPDGDVSGLRIGQGGDLSTEYRPDVILRALQAIGAVDEIPDVTSARNVAESVLTLVERFARSYQRRNPVCTEDTHLRGIFADPKWSKIQRLLLDEGVVTEELRASRGPAKTFLRRQVQPEHILLGTNKNAPVPDAVRRFWDRLELDFPAQKVKETH